MLASHTSLIGGNCSCSFLSCAILDLSHFDFSQAITVITSSCHTDQHQVRYRTVGCYKDDQVDPRPLPELLADLSGEVDWYDLEKVIRKCAQLAKDKDYTYFGMQSFGQCRSGKTAASSYNQDGNSSGCQSGLGGRGENLVFEIISSRKYLH